MNDQQPAEPQGVPKDYQCRYCGGHHFEMYCSFRNEERLRSGFDKWWDEVGIQEMPRGNQPPEHALIARKAWFAALTDTPEKRVSDLERQLAEALLRIQELEERARMLASNANRC